MKSNQDLILEFANKHNLYPKYLREFQAYLFNTKITLYPYLFDDKCKELWDNYHPEINLAIIFNSFIPWKQKIYFITSKFLKLSKTPSN